MPFLSDDILKLDDGGQVNLIENVEPIKVADTLIVSRDLSAGIGANLVGQRIIVNDSDLTVVRVDASQLSTTLTESLLVGDFGTVSLDYDELVRIADSVVAQLGFRVSLSESILVGDSGSVSLSFNESVRISDGTVVAQLVSSNDLSVNISPETIRIVDSLTVARGLTINIGVNSVGERFFLSDTINAQMAGDLSRQIIDSNFGEGERVRFSDNLANNPHAVLVGNDLSRQIIDSNFGEGERVRFNDSLPNNPHTVLIEFGNESVNISESTKVIDSVGASMSFTGNMSVSLLESLRVRETLPPLVTGLEEAPNGVNKRYEVFANGASIDITDDVTQGLSVYFGISGNGPLDLVADTGTCKFTLRNDAQPGKLRGRYSVAHPTNKMVGWGFGIPFRLTVIFQGVPYPRFYGKIRIIDPDTGPHGRLQVEVVAYDIMRDLAEADIREFSIPVGQSESAVIDLILNSVTAEAQPLARSLTAGVDVLPYSLHDLGGDTKAMTAIAKVARSSSYVVVVKSDGTLVGLTRHSYTIGTNRYTFDGDFTDLEVPSDAEAVISIARARVHPVTIGDTLVVLYALTGAPPVISPGQTITIWGSYNDVDNAQRLIGGLNFESLVAGTDYAGNSASDGSGTDLTASLTVTATTFATTVKFEITNDEFVLPVYLVTTLGATLLQVRGNPVRDLGPQTLESVEGTIGKPVLIDLPYQADPNVGQSVADYNYFQRNATRFQYQVNGVSFRANRSTAKMIAALSVEPGDQVVVTEPVNGLTLVAAIVQSVTLEEYEGVLDCRLGLAPAAPFDTWQVEVSGRSEVEETTVVGY